MAVVKKKPEAKSSKNGTKGFPFIQVYHSSLAIDLES